MFFSFINTETTPVQFHQTSALETHKDGKNNLANIIDSVKLQIVTQNLTCEFWNIQHKSVVDYDVIKEAGRGKHYLHAHVRHWRSEIL